MRSTTYAGWFGLGLFAISLVWFASLTTYEMIRNPATPNRQTQPPAAKSNAPVATKKPTCFPGCEKVKILPGKQDTDQVETVRWQCSRKSMYEGGKDGGLCDNLTECREPNPTCCCYDFQCNSCNE